MPAIAAMVPTVLRQIRPISQGNHAREEAGHKRIAMTLS
jgi:hypothetical protein